MLNEIPQPLLQPRRLGDLLLPNRVVMAPLARGRANNSGHVPNDLMRDGLHQRLSLRREDLFISLVEVTKENWSFGNGEAQYATAPQ